MRNLSKLFGMNFFWALNLHTWIFNFHIVSEFLAVSSPFSNLTMNKVRPTIWQIYIRKIIEKIKNKGNCKAFRVTYKHKKASNVWFKLFSRQNSFWRWWNKHLVYQPVHKYFKKHAKSNKIIPWISKRSDESIKTPATYDSSLSPGIVVPNYEWNLMEAV